MGIIRNEQFLTLKEHQEICEAVDIMDQQFTDDVIDKAVYYDVTEDPVSLMANVTVFGEDGEVIATASVEDYDVAIAYLEDTFDLEPMDDDDIDSDVMAGSTRYGQG